VKVKPCFWSNVEPIEEKLNFEKPIVEIGFGTGDFTLWLAEKFKENPILAVDKWHPGVRVLIHKCLPKRLENLYVFNLDANLFVEYLLKPNQVERFYFNYPDPFFKKRDLKRRLLKTSFLKWVAFKLKEGGKVYIRTDIPDYYEYILEQLKPLRGIYEVYRDFDEELPPTKYERKAIKEGRKPLKLLLVKVKNPEDLTDREVEKLRTLKVEKYNLENLQRNSECKDPRGYFLKIENTYKGENVDLVEIYVGEERFFQHVFVGIFKNKEGSYVIKPKSFAVGVRSLSWAVEKLAELLTK
jgi:tRNA (guanine-N7-)-methyltransferase